MEAVLDASHPLHRYLTESLDDAFRVNMPGASDDLLMEQIPLDDTKEMRNDTGSHDAVDAAFWAPAARWAIQSIALLLEYASVTDTPAMEFAERFKYVVISSSLLDTSLGPMSALPYNVSRFLTPPTTPTLASAAPHLALSLAHDRLPNLDPLLTLNSPPISPPPATQSHQQQTSVEKQPLWKYVLSSPTIRRNAPVLAVVAALALNGYMLFALLALLALKTTRTGEIEAQKEARNQSYATTLACLRSLISASDVWGSVVAEAMGILEAEERRLFYGPSSPHSPSSSLRVTLSSTLQSTQSQTDNVRQLFTPLTSSSQLSRLSEMYAPPPPTPKPIMAALGSPGHQRPMSVSGTRSKRSSVVPISSDMRRTESLKQDKRSTWSGPASRSLIRRANSLQAMAGEESLPPSRVPSPRRLSTVFGEDAESLASSSSTNAVDAAVAGPSSSRPQEASKPSALAPPPTTPRRTSKEDLFTATPPMIKRRRRNSSVSMGSPANRPPPLNTGRPGSADNAHLKSPIITHSRSHNSLAASPLSPRVSFVQTTRHPLSLTALHDQLQSAIASKRFTSAHLLALRFGDLTGSAAGSEEEAREDLELLDGEDESYWEDVRSVMSLLTSSMEDASARLVDAIEESKREKEKDMQVTPLTTAFPHRDNAPEQLPSGRKSPQLFAPPNSASGLSPSSVWSRNGSVAAPALSPSSGSFAPTPNHLMRFASHVNSLLDAMDKAKMQLRECVSLVDVPESELPYAAESSSAQQEAAVQAYDKLRKELSTALREFERGRGSLLDLLKHRNAVSAPPEESDGEEEDGVPALAHDQSSVEADSEDRHGPMLPVHSAIYDAGLDDDSASSPVDDPDSSHLIETEILPPTGIEQVFAYDSKDEVLPKFSRERSMLSREERIAQAKARRSTAQSPMLGSAKSDSAWGPGGEVVQELKHVISRVEERRKRAPSQRLSQLGDLATSPSPEPIRVAVGSPIIETADAEAPSSPPTLAVHEVDTGAPVDIGMAM